MTLNGDNVCVSPVGSTDIRESAEALVRGDWAQCEAEDRRSGGQRQKS